METVFGMTMKNCEIVLVLSFDKIVSLSKQRYYIYTLCLGSCAERVTKYVGIKCWSCNEWNDWDG